MCRKCIGEGCTKQPNYNTYGETKALYCSVHKKQGMVNVNTPNCIAFSCKTRPTFNKNGETKGLYCYVHKKQGMVNVNSKRCSENGCYTRPNFNTEGETKPLYCYVHKKQGMVDVRSPRCIEIGCYTIPIYNTYGETKALYCSVHKKQGMVNIKSKRCIGEGCTKQPNYNTEGQTKPLYCSVHKKEGMVDVKNKSCKSDWCFKIVQKKYDGYCLYCFMNLFPDKPVSRNYKTKEYSVVEYVKTHFSDVDWIADKIVNGGCSRRRPDLLLDLGYQIVIIEVDENQHTNYDCSCENKRLMELSQDLGHRPIVFIRFNPDEYDKDGENITSCWGQDKKGICVVKKSKKKEWEERLLCLKQQIDYWINPENVTNKTIECVQLYYDV